MTRTLLSRTFQLVLVTTAIVALVACPSAGAGSDEPQEDSSLVDIVADTAELSNLLTVIEYVDANGTQDDANDLSTLLAGTGPFTVFAPNNAAFVAALDLDDDTDFDTDDVAALEAALGSASATADALYSVVANHVTSGATRSSDLSAGLAINTLAGDGYPWGLSVNADVTGVRATFTDAGLTSTIDVEASNGVAHVIDAVLLDDATASALDGNGVETGSTLAEIVTTNPDLTGLAAVITYVDANGSQADADDLAELLGGDGPFTAFVPNNAAFVAALDLDDDTDFDTDDVAALEAALGSATAAADALYLVVANHVTAADEVLSNELTGGQAINTLAPDGYPWGLSVNGDVTGVRATFTDAGLTSTIDVQAINGVAHVVDAVLLDDATASALDGAGVDTGSTLAEIVTTDADLEGLAAVIGYIDANGSQDAADNLATILGGTGPFTAFVPNDAAFDAALDLDADGQFVESNGSADAGDIAALEAALGSATAAADALYLVVANHVTAADEVLSNELTDGQAIETLAGTGADYGLTIDLSSGVTVIPSYTPSEADVVAADVQALNGVAHVIDSVLLDDTTAGALGLDAD